MPKGSKYICATCGKWERISLKEHHKKVHQKECTVHFKGEPGRVTCRRDADGLWRCPKCRTGFEGTPRKLQAHGLKGECLDVLEGVHQPQHNYEEPEPQLEHDEEMQYRPEEVEQNEDVDALDGEFVEVDAVIPHDDILGNYINELDDEEAFIKHLLDEEARDVQDVEIKLDSDMGPDWERGLLQPSSAMVKQEQLNTNNDSFPPGRDTITPERWSTVTEEEEKKPVFDHSIGMPRSGTTTSSLNTPRPPSTAQWASLQPSYGSIPGNAYVEDSSGHDSVQRSGSTPAGSAAATSSSSSTSYLPSKSYQHSASTAAHRHVPEPSLPPALKAFFATLRVPSEHLAPIFIRQRMTTDDALDLLCEAPPRELEGIKTEILEEGRLAGWLAVQKGLEERARSRAMRWVEV